MTVPFEFKSDHHHGIEGDLDHRIGRWVNRGHLMEVNRGWVRIKSQSLDLVDRSSVVNQSQEGKEELQNFIASTILVGKKILNYPKVESREAPSVIDLMGGVEGSPSLIVVIRH
jgi:hypothetical protein